MRDGGARMRASFATALSKAILCLNFRTSFVPAALFRFRWYRVVAFQDLRCHLLTCGQRPVSSPVFFSR